MPPSPRKPNGKPPPGKAPPAGGKSSAGKSSEAKAIAPAKPSRPRPAFPKKNQVPTPDEFAARLPLANGKRWDAVRTFLGKLKQVTEDVFYYGPKSGWALRYMVDDRTPLCSLFVLGDQPLAIVSLTADDARDVDWSQLSPIAAKARKNAHGSPSLLWLDVPLDGPGATDLKSLVKAKLRRLSPPPDAS